MDSRYPTKASKYWQCVREQNVYLEQIMRLSFEYRRNESKIRFTKDKIKTLSKELEDAELGGIDSSTDEWFSKKQYSLEKYQIDLDELNFSRANMELVARDRMREIKLWSKLKVENDDGSFDKQNVNTHQLDAYHKVMENRKDTLSPQSSQPEVFNVIGQLKTIERIKKEKKHIEKTGYIINPLLVVEDNDRYKVVYGNNRYLAAEELGHEEIPIQVLKDEDNKTIVDAAKTYKEINIDET